MLETVFVFLPFFALVFAIIDYSMVVFLQGTFKHAVRVGVRFAITGRLVAGESGHINSIKAIVQQNAMGFLNGDSGRQKITVRFYDPLTFAEVTGANSNQSGNIVEVTISPCANPPTDCYTWGWMAPLQTGWTSSGSMTGRRTTPLAISARSSDRLEPPPGGVPPAL
jgi:Flp pilus assembly protein TadG